ncbi:MAG: ScpA family protein, partial [Hyphomicrobiaceae bacterium]
MGDLPATPTGPVAADPFLAEEDRPAGEALVVDLDGFEGPLDLLLALARTHKLDLSRISILALAEQYLAFIENAEQMRLELAADYLVMAAWLAFLKSRLLIPKEEVESEEITGEELAARLAFRLRRLEAMRDAAGRIMARAQTGRDMALRGDPEGVTIARDSRYTANVYDLLKAYAEIRRRTAVGHVTIKARHVWSIKEARNRLERLIGPMADWAPLDQFLRHYGIGKELSATALASSFGAILELTREGALEIRQSQHFGPILV